MLCYEDPWKEKMGDGVSIKELQEALRTGKDGENMIKDKDFLKKLFVLEERLTRVKSRGGAYSVIEFSPDIQMILDGRNSNLQSESIVS
ncbi:MAG: hypothetical protein AMJ79_13630 [Phycisphaerae bacterium SM23_30]|nr:MAG: hypothetical protein AMJ79_13630 [Phycisphaerae bacterium SM23_30]